METTNRDCRKNYRYIICCSPVGPVTDMVLSTVMADLAVDLDYIIIIVIIIITVTVLTMKEKTWNSKSSMRTLYHTLLMHCFTNTAQRSALDTSMAKVKHDWLKLSQYLDSLLALPVPVILPLSIIIWNRHRWHTDDKQHYNPLFMPVDCCLDKPCNTQAS